MQELTVVTSELNLLKQNTMPLTKTPTSSLSGDYATFFPPLPNSRLLFQRSSYSSAEFGIGLELESGERAQGYFTRDLHDTLVPSHQASLGARRNHRLLSLLRHV